MSYGIILLLLLCVMILWRSEYENSHFKIVTYRLPNRKIKTPVRVVYLSDLHENVFGRENEELLQAIRMQKPDILLLGGDLIIGKGKRVECDHALHFLRELGEICPVYYSYGNHETRVKEDPRFRRYENEIKKLPVTLLNNERAELTVRGQSVQIFGLELTNRQYKDKKEFQAAGTIFDPACLSILLAHTPDYFPEYTAWKPDFVFSGHNHGGIVRLFGTCGVMANSGHPFPKYSYGIYREQESVMVLSAGAGTHTIRFRLGNQTEFVVADLVQYH